MGEEEQRWAESVELGEEDPQKELGRKGNSETVFRHFFPFFLIFFNFQRSIFFF